MAAAAAASHVRHSSASSVVPSRPASSGSTLPSATSNLAQSAAMRAAAPTASSPRFSADSPVMNETLSVIDEHITDMHTPRSSYVNGNKRDTMSSIYSTQPLNRLSYIPGHETDEDDHQNYTEAEVMAWAPERVAEYLEDHGVERPHCDVFREQEISGEVLLAMDQSSLFIKEFSLGPVGRRLKTWHKIKALQDEVRRSESPVQARALSQYSDGHEESAQPRDRSATVGAILPRALDTSLSRQSADRGMLGMSATMPLGPAELEAAPSEVSTELQMPSNRNSSVISPLQSMTSVPRSQNPYRPSAQTIRVHQSRRHSSIDSSSEAGVGIRQSHRKQPSIEKKWQPGQPRNGTASHSHTWSTDSIMSKREDANPIPPASPQDLEKGYFSSNDIETSTTSSRRKRLNLLTKGSSSKKSPVSKSSRANSFISSTSTRNPSSPLAPSNMFSLLGTVSNRHEKSVAPITSTLIPASLPSEPKAMTKTASEASPMVTRLEYNDTPSLPEKKRSGAESNATPSPSSTHFGLFNMPRFGGPRTTSGATTKNEKILDLPADKQSLSKEDSPARTGSTTPSTETRSFDLPKSDAQSRASTGTSDKLMPPPVTTRRPRAGTKKTTSAYTQGLEKKSPTESMTACDYSGWMKKKSGSLMSTWKPRLFILRGRRLSYYYKEDDVEEKGLIDISFHRVLPAHNETLTGLHAAMTGAGGNVNASNPKDGATMTTAQEDLLLHPAKGDDDEGLFIFKLVPPKAGLSKAVNFTKPTVHYFAVNSRQEGRLWMAALMKATIDRNDQEGVTTTYNQKTISLAKARERKERPPALQEEDRDDESRVDIPPSSTGLGIMATDLIEPPVIAGAERSEPLGSLQDLRSSIASIGDLPRDESEKGIRPASGAL